MKDTLKKQRLFFISLIGIVVVSLAMGTTFAYQTIIMNETPDRDVSIQSGKLDVRLNITNNSLGDNRINNTNIDLVPDYKYSNYTEFTVDNRNSSDPIMFKVNLIDLDYSSILRHKDFKYTLVSVDETNHEILEEGNFSNLSSNEFEFSKYVYLENEIKTYRLYLWIQETQETQNDFENSYFRCKLSVNSVFFSMFSDNPYANNSNSLAFNIINNAMNVRDEEEAAGYAVFRTEPLTKPAEQESLDTESILSVTLDDYSYNSGVDSYYFRGNVKNNYVNFAGMCWRIVRIDGNGNAKLILEDQDEVCSASMNGNWGIPITTGGTTYTGNYGYELKNIEDNASNQYIMSYLKPVTNADKSMARAFYDFQKDKLEDYKSKLKSGNWCLADEAYTRSGSSPNYTYTQLGEYNYSSSMYYDSYVRLYNNSVKKVTLKCNGTTMDNFESVTYNGTEIIEESPMYASTLTADEIVYAGGKVYSATGNFYLLNENFKSGNAGYDYFWSLTPYSFNGSYDSVFHLNKGGYVGGNYVDYERAFRPAISLVSNVDIIGGKGTVTYPYTIK